MNKNFVLVVLFIAVLFLPACASVKTREVANDNSARYKIGSLYLTGAEIDGGGFIPENIVVQATGDENDNGTPDEFWWDADKDGKQTREEFFHDMNEDGVIDMDCDTHCLLGNTKPDFNGFIPKNARGVRAVDNDGNGKAEIWWWDKNGNNEVEKEAELFHDVNEDGVIDMDCKTHCKLNEREI